MGQLEPVIQDHVQVAFEYSKVGDYTVSLGNLLQYSVTLTTRKCFLVFSLMCFSLCPLPLHTGQHWRRPGFHLLCTIPSTIYIHWQDPPWVFSRLNTHSFLSLSSFKRCSSPLIIFIASLSYSGHSLNCFALNWELSMVSSVAVKSQTNPRVQLLL